jgi:hypothetical protein
MITANDFIKAAAAPGLIGTPYSDMDCQALVEKMLAICGVKRNWRGCNDMARHALSWLGTMEECEAQYAMIPHGAWLFRWANDGGEKARGYTDGKGNYFHVGVYLGNGQVIESTTGGVQYTSLPNKKWNRVGLSVYIDYTPTPPKTEETLFDRLLHVSNMLSEILSDISKEGFS